LEREIGMTKSELVRKLAEANPRLHHHDVEVIVTVFFEQIVAALARMSGRITPIRLVFHM
jgi:nucleoid DNA-binding protein